MENSSRYDNEGRGKSTSNCSNKVIKLVIKCAKKTKSDVDGIPPVFEEGESSSIRDTLGFEKTKNVDNGDQTLTLYSHGDLSSRSETKDMKNNNHGKSSKGLKSNSSSRSKKRDTSYNQLGLEGKVDQTLRLGFTSPLEKPKTMKMKMDGNVNQTLELKLGLGFTEEKNEEWSWSWVALHNEEIDGDIFEVKRKMLLEKQEMLLKKQEKERSERLKWNKRRALIRIPVDKIEDDVSVFIKRRYRRKPNKRMKNHQDLDHLFPGGSLVGVSLASYQF